MVWNTTSAAPSRTVAGAVSAVFMLSTATLVPFRKMTAPSSARSRRVSPLMLVGLATEKVFLK